MSMSNSNVRWASQLRQRAEDRLANHARASMSAESDRQYLVHELQVHQVELEMQNEELLQSNRNLTQSRDEYRELFDFSPVGYVKVWGADDEMMFNMTLLMLLELPIESRGISLASYISGSDREVWDNCLRRLRQDKHRDRCRLRLLTVSGSVIFVEVFLTRFDTLHGGAILGAVVPIDESAYHSSLTRISG